MNRNRTIRLLWQLYPTYLFITLIALGAVSWYAAEFLSSHFYSRTLSDLKNQGRIAEVLIDRHLAPLDATAIDRHCKRVGRAAPARITVIMPDGEVIGDSEENPEVMDNHIDRPEIRVAVTGETGSSTRYSRTLGKRMMYVALPLKREGQIRAIMRVSIPLTGVDEELGNIQSSVAFGGFLIAVLSAIICYYVSRRISQPIEKLREGAENFAAGKLDHRLLPPSTRETAALAEAMNSMAASLEQRIESENNQRNEMEAILASMSEGVIAIDMEEHILSFNQAATAIVRGLDEKTKGQALQEIVRSVPLQQFVNRTREEERAVSEDIALHQTDERTLNVHATPLRDAREVRIGTLLVLSDVTQLRHLEKMRQDFVANVSHEIKTPLTAIKGFVETLQNGAKDHPEEAARFIAIIEKHANRLEAIIEDLLQLSRIEKENEARQIRFAEGPVCSVLRSAMQICRAKAESREIEMELHCDDSLTVTINAVLLEQAIVNLVDNAIKYSGEKGKIVMDARRTSEALCISVRDNGRGISKKHLPRLFERFYRADKARSRDQGGTGLGLAIVKHIIRAHGGCVTVDSQRGEGSTFTIHLPLP